MGFFLVMKAEIVRSFIIMRRYWFRTIIGLVMGYGMLLVLILGFIYNQETLESAVENRIGDPVQATNFLLGFIIGLFAFGVVGMFSQGLQDMARTGVLEQLCLSPHGLITNFMARSMVSATTTILSSAILVWLVAWKVGGRLHFEAVPVLTLLVLTFVSLLGFGFVVGGLVLVFKQVGQIAMLLRMALFGLAIFAREELLDRGAAFASLMHALPITDAAICLKYVLVRGQMTQSGEFASVFAHTSFRFLLLSCVVWTSIGVFCFRYMENWSRSRGTLGAY